MVSKICTSGDTDSSGYYRHNEPLVKLMFKCGRDRAVCVNCNGEYPFRNVTTKKQVYRFILNHQRLREFLFQNNGHRWQCNPVVVVPSTEDGDPLAWWLGLCWRQSQFGHASQLESHQLLQIRCKFGMPPQNHRAAEAVLTITLTQHCQRFNTRFLQSNTDFITYCWLRLHFHIHTITNAQLWQHKHKSLSLNSYRRVVNCVAMITSHLLEVTSVVVLSVHSVCVVWKGGQNFWRGTPTRFQ